jgi:hypothetical protein
MSVVYVADRHATAVVDFGQVLQQIAAAPTGANYAVFDLVRRSLHDGWCALNLTNCGNTGDGGRSGPGNLNNVSASRIGVVWHR